MKLTTTNRILLTCVSIILIGGMLVWEHFNGGVKTHYMLQDDSLPGISNYWGLLVGGIVAWVTLYRIQTRVEKKPETEKLGILKKTLLRFLVALVFGITLAMFFSMGNAQVSEAMTLGILVVSFLIPLYKAEYLLGYVLGLSFTIGVVLPTFFGLILIAICWVTYNLPRWILLKLKPKKI